VRDLDLTYLATGTCQHVFVKSDEASPRWVYKTPATMAYALYVLPRLRKYTPPKGVKSALFAALLRFPEELYEGVQGRLAAGVRPHLCGRLGLILTLTDRFFGCARAGRDKLLAEYYRKSREQKFKAMLRMMEYLSRHGLAEVLVPYHVIHLGSAVLHINGTTIAYRGPLVVQQWADVIDTSARLDAFPVRELVAVQHRLWRHGVALTDDIEILGPKNWALLDGRLYLADTSSLTRDFDQAYRSLGKKDLDARQRETLQRLRSGLGKEAEEYFRFVRREINQDRLQRLWKADLRH